MWPIYAFVNKYLKTYHGILEESDTDLSHLVSMNGSQNSFHPHSHFVEVPHIRQHYSWDCGLACVLMVLKTLGVDDCDFNALVELCNTTSIWTMDLAYLLQKYSISFAFFTVTLGVNPDFSGEMFYKDQLPNDTVRVDNLFQKALEARINIQCRSISGEELSVLILSGNYVAIALVDQYKLRNYSPQNHASICACSSPSWLEGVCVSSLYPEDTGYTGHFVVICGYDADKGEFDIRDPASFREYEKVNLNCLEEARKSFGTDEDLLLISLKKDGKSSNTIL